jgi:tyrosyl-DNA phosphodiesterase-1
MTISQSQWSEFVPIQDKSSRFLLLRAIALSLQEFNPTSQAGGSLKHTDGNVDERFQADLERALAASQTEQTRASSPATSVTSSTDSESASTRPTTTGIASSSSKQSTRPYTTESFLSERAQLEQARLARLKRYREQSGQLEAEGRPSKRKTPSKSPEERSFLKGKQTASRNDQGLVLNGEVRQTANKYAYPGKNGEDGNPVWRLSEIIGDVRASLSDC